MTDYDFTLVIHLLIQLLRHIYLALQITNLVNKFLDHRNCALLQALRQDKLGLRRNNFQMEISLVYPSYSKLPGQTNFLNSLTYINLKEL